MAPPSLLERERELGLLRAAWGRARAGHGSLWLICGEAGAGKSRLAAEAAAQGRCLWGAADPITPPEPFAAVARAIPGFAPAPSRAESVARALAALAESAGDGPLILVLDDLHFADDGTVAVLARLATVCGARPWLILAAFRPDEGPASLRQTAVELAAQGAAHRLEPAPLSRDAVARLFGALRGRAPGDDDLDTIYADSGGNPWLAEALARGDDTLSLARERAEVRVRRLDEVAPGALAVALALAPATGALPHALVAELRGGDGPALRRALTALRTAGMLSEADGAWRFRHELLRRALLDAIPEVDRRHAHRALAELIERHVPAPREASAPGEGRPGARWRPSSAAVAMHFAEAAEPRAGPWALRAAREAAAVEAHAEAIAQFRRALDYETEPESRRAACSAIALSAFSLSRFAESLAAAEEALAVPDGEPEGRARDHWAAARAAFALGDHLKDERHLSEAERVLDGQPVIFAAVQVATARVARASRQALPDRLEAAAGRALELVRRLPDRAEAPRAEMEIRRAVLGARLNRGDPAAFPELEELVRFAEGHSLHDGHALAAVTGFQGGAAFQLFHREADNLYGRAIDGMRRLRFAWEPFVEPYRVLELVQRGRYADARALAASLPLLGAELEQSAILLLAEVMIEARAGSLERARALIAAARPAPLFKQTVVVDLARLEVATVEENPALGEMAWWIYLVGEARQYARVAAVAAVALVRGGGEPPVPPDWLVADAPLRAFWEWAEGLARGDAALLRAVAGRLGEMALPFEAAVALADAGELAAAYRSLRALEATTPREALAARLRALGQPVPRRTRAAAEPHGLTGSERTIVRLIVEGARNAEIATRLGVSVNTVETHVSHLYQKAGARGRVALAAWWGEQSDE